LNGGSNTNNNSHVVEVVEVFPMAGDVGEDPGIWRVHRRPTLSRVATSDGRRTTIPKSPTRIVTPYSSISNINNSPRAANDLGRRPLVVRVKFWIWRLQLQIVQATPVVETTNQDHRQLATSDSGRLLLTYRQSVELVPRSYP
jgi:hypothetical protein